VSGHVITIARKEWLEAFRDGRILLAGGLTTALLLVASLLGALTWRTAARERADAEALTRAQWVGQGETNPHSAAHYGVYAFKPTPILAAIEPGANPYAGTVAHLEAHRMNEFRFRPAQDASELQRFAGLTPAAILQTLVPLLIVIVCFGAFAGERDQGTLRQLLALGVTPGQLLRGKMLGLGGVVFAWIGGAALLGGAAILGFADVSASTLARELGVFLLPHLALYAGWLLLAIGVSAWAPSSRVALLTLFALWGFGSVIAPRLLTGAVSAAVPTPTMEEFSAQVAADQANGVDGHSPRAERTRAFRDSVLRHYGVDSVEQLPISFEGLALQQGEEDADRILDVRYGDLWRRLERQEILREYLGVVAPGIATRNLAMAIAGTDVAAHHRFQQQAEAYRRRLVKAMNDDVTQHGGSTPFEYVRGSDLWASVPPFEYVPVQGHVAATTHPVAIVALLAWLVWTTVVALTGTRRLTGGAG
jgi:ABC-2 type transport system permease protein